MEKIRVIQQIHEQGVVAVLRGNSPEEVVEMAAQAIAGGIRVIEVTMTVPNALQAIEQLRRMYSSQSSNVDRFAIIGAGTVLEPATARACILAGSEFIVGPSLNADTIKMCNLYRIPVMPGVMTIGEVQEALELGADIIKLFPGNLYEPSIIGTIKGPMPQANIMPTGGVNVANLGDWIKAGAVAVGIGSDLTKEAIASGDMTLVRKKAEQYMEAYHRAKTNLSLQPQ
ncbi:bifunctional 2-keto-4-hydroxyglutarate aldolase/2-keto-3-deoxy-6-phosphogluconate aldolase [Paenibacillus apiarius]|uniref:Bifunctional 2-keto-4-hydroxyglutarate aldolase/2-keto-3-deoxy-6-phosphogluconate aldolase n=1 Tax=Paenibacillus apiarius TaxID=46240 RepID=A0ABT4E165_9BACL|nr:bifunctional 2-keto-4-hydroxyglutarate aldolase/2-keto-3-deoxy-6-phosphogluconate aldolase [Paenibacillus apiarius]MCY9512878.1 bifunctional 2-keto-4-hydroxyglutarate aldolase/2-keto-3-deoxy-6-phosphogluconate aldolase [Paenibacillus apiarius]MCY9522073.1 bifunctional 2-keto-4-hydroxyglutarate aldolase/2-keto-3-deoxy-6-phosphogluconate aldolase [Paenibacillus apiarius]MCY9554108.1 bifunctional 2-keto-4-hydroxyglutarate aldolase/2-keto-3-deoxy-6-phosphogluconate aldolase [Paenibacillus apiariu